MDDENEDVLEPEEPEDEDLSDDKDEEEAF